MFKYKINSPYVFFESPDFSKARYDANNNQPYDDTPTVVWLSIEPGRWSFELDSFEQVYEAGQALIWTVEHSGRGMFIVRVDGVAVSLDKLSDLINRRKAYLIDYYKSGDWDIKELWE